MGTSFGFVPVLIPIAVGMGLPAALGAALCGGVAMALVGMFLPVFRFLFPPVVTGTFVVMLGTLLMPVGFAYWGGGFGAADFGATHHLLLGALVGCGVRSRGGGSSSDDDDSAGSSGTRFDGSNHKPHGTGDGS